MKSINVKKIEFSNVTENVVLFGFVREDMINDSSVLTRIVINQAELNKMISRIQATTMNIEDEILDHLTIHKIDSIENLYTIDLSTTAYEDKWIELYREYDNYTLIRA